MAITRKDKIMDLFEKTIPKHYKTKEVRTRQVQMAMEVAAFLHPKEKKRLLLIEAPVGTGKSLGALVPALIESTIDSFSPKRISYVTATINLQGQLMNGEVPLLQKYRLLKQAILAKGKSHYYCHEQLQSPATVDNHDEIYNNLNRFFLEGSSGQRDEYESTYGEIPSKIWDRVALRATKSECEKCALSHTCPTNHHRRQFNMDNHLVITNHEQMIRSLLNRLSDPPVSPIVPIDPGIVIIDEAHHFLDNFLSQIESSVSIRELKTLITSKHFPYKHKKSCIGILSKLEVELKRCANEVESLQGRYPLSSTTRSILTLLLNKLDDVLEDIVLQSINERRQTYSLSQFSDRLEAIIESVRTLNDTKMFVQWVSYDDFSFSFIPVNFPTSFRRMMNFLLSHNKVIVMSGTLTNDGSFSSLIAQWRLNKENLIEKIIPESFDYGKQALIYVPQNVADPRDQNSDWIEDQVNHLNNILHITQGRALILSTSKQHMQDLSEPLESICDSLDVTLLRQDQGGVEKLTELFKQDETSVLLGSGSFFSGFSVPGTSLVSVTFSRLPFPVPDDPYLKLIGQGLEDTFMEDVLFPKMMVQLNQGSGRLIRDIRDYGIITILDPRVFTSGYGALIRSDFERKGYLFTRSLEEVQEFYKRKIKSGSEAKYVSYSQELISIPAILEEGGFTSNRGEAILPKETKYKRSKITPEQHEFALTICKERGVNLSTKPKFGEDLYKYLVDLYYVKYHNISPVRDHFPYKNELQKNELLDYYGQGIQTYQAKKCTDPVFGCSGQCSLTTQEEIRKAIESSGGDLSNVFQGTGHCWLEIKPYNKNDEILMKCASLRSVQSK
ncbi:ATP-dependent DNA helicase [Paenibacillus sp. Dod16]|uniref:ATP-dependent DNA helicase n=1 Tax=Paenibacillus sp. Dod16 TaxID=3416392 RepID=UPI003CED72A9